MKNWQLLLILSAIYAAPHLPGAVSKLLSSGLLVLAAVAGIMGD